MRPKIWLVQWGRSASTRCPSKVTRDFCDTTLFELGITRHLQYIKPDRIVASIPEGPRDDLLARFAEQMGIEVFRNRDNGPLSTNLEMVDFFKMADDDIQLNTSPDVPFTYIEDIQYRIDALIDSDKNFTEPLPEGPFPHRDWEWACCYKRVWKAKTSRLAATAAIDQFGSQARPGDARLFWAMLVETGLHRPLIIEKPEPAKEPWPWQPLWIDEEAHFLQAEMIVKALGTDGLKDRAIRGLFDKKPLLATMTANAPRSTVKVFQEYRRGVDALRRVADRDGVVPQWRGWEDD
jgi:hypothetical protein